MSEWNEWNEMNELKKKENQTNVGWLVLWCLQSPWGIPNLNGGTLHGLRLFFTWGGVVFIDQAYISEVRGVRFDLSPPGIMTQLFPSQSHKQWVGASDEKKEEGEIIIDGQFACIPEDVRSSPLHPPLQHSQPYSRCGAL